ncbi:leader peptidase (prepilin peptidase)/N-methyltransferase [Labedaea rhizosphaerae]|uniref:Leader peptidase (Prepilin peptidase)/N-methyltransferase n=2 Tax=Labedaea rhizosphaerae TaxID=598644 RepID=A0A4R6SHD0_LABRH|nr:leader peptidase (prepilin peptidase)/N-methyltransferase [Labedaea rhizosphaerae]
MIVSGVAGAPAGWIGSRLLARSVRVRPLWCVVGTATVWCLVGARFGSLPPWWLPVPVLLGWFTVLLTAADLAHRRLPDPVNLLGYPALGAAVVVAASWGGVSLGLAALLGVLVFGGAHLAVHWWRPDALGAGDVKLAGWLGGVLGVLGWPAMVLVTVVASVCSLVLRLAPAWRTTGAPHGPGLLAAAWLATLFPVLPVASPP